MVVFLLVVVSTLLLLLFLSPWLMEQFNAFQSNPDYGFDDWWDEKIRRKRRRRKQKENLYKGSNAPLYKPGKPGSSGGTMLGGYIRGTGYEQVDSSNPVMARDLREVSVAGYLKGKIGGTAANLAPGQQGISSNVSSMQGSLKR